MSGQDRWSAAMAAMSTLAAEAAQTAATQDPTEGEEESPTLKAETDYPEGTFTSVAAEGGEVDEDGLAGEGQGGGLDIESATTFSTPGTWRMSDVYSAIYDSWRAWRAVQGSETRDKAKVSGL